MKPSPHPSCVSKPDPKGQVSSSTCPSSGARHVICFDVSNPQTPWPDQGPMFTVEQGRREGRRGPCEEGERAGEKGGGLPRTEGENAVSRKKQGQEQGRKMRERILRLDAVSGMDFIAYCEILMKTRSSVFFFFFM